MATVKGSDAGGGQGEAVKAVLAAETERDRRLLRTLRATGGRVSEVLALRATDIRRDA